MALNAEKPLPVVGMPEAPKKEEKVAEAPAEKTEESAPKEEAKAEEKK